ncbi:MAG TPA: type II CAAX endopeptidase family protein [Candidatus Acidoferrales bacterium]|nr:type II CAAX endopeptidase family protein [Candidatus Acidoferrales bacterium]
MEPASPKRPEPLGQRIFLGADGLLRPIWRVVLFVFLGGLGLTATSRGFSALLPYVPVLRSETLRAGSIIQYLLINAALLLMTALFIRVLDRRSVRTLGLWFYAGWGREAAMGICCGGALIAATVGGIVVSGGAYYPGLAENSVFWLLQAVPAGVFVLLAAAAEEIAFRGYAFQRLVDSIGALGAVLVLSALFGVVHLRNPGHPTAISTANTALAGVLLAVAYLKTRGLWLPIGLHAAWNFFQGPVFGLPVSGFTAPFKPYLLSTQVAGPEWLTGSAYGPEGSIILTVTCVAAIVWLARTKSVFPSLAMREVLE